MMQCLIIIYIHANQVVNEMHLLHFSRFGYVYQPHVQPPGPPKVKKLDSINPSSII